MLTLLPTPTEPLPDVLELAMVADWLRVPLEAETTTLQRLVRSAMGWAEGVCGEPLFRRGYSLSTTGFTGGYLPGVNPAIDAVSYRVDEVDTELDATHYTVLNGHLTYGYDPVPGHATYDWPVTLTYQAGYDKANLPEDIQQALLLHVYDSYDNRANPVAERLTAAEKLLQRYKRYTC